MFSTGKRNITKRLLLSLNETWLLVMVFFDNGSCLIPNHDPMQRTAITGLMVHLSTRFLLSWQLHEAPDDLVAVLQTAHKCLYARF